MARTDPTRRAINGPSRMRRPGDNEIQIQLLNVLTYVG